MRTTAVVLAALLAPGPGCSLDLDRLRADAGTSLDAPGLDAPGLDAPALDAPEPDAPGLDADRDAAPVSDASGPDASGPDASYGFPDGPLEILASSRGRTDAEARLAVGRDDRGAFFTLVSPTSFDRELVTRTSCAATLSPSAGGGPSGAAVAVADLDTDGTLDEIAMDGTQVSIAFGLAADLEFEVPLTVPHFVTTPRLVAVGTLGAAELPEIVVANRMNVVRTVTQAPARSFTGMRVAPVGAGSLVIDAVIMDADDGNAGDELVLLVATSSGAARAIEVVFDDGIELRSGPTRDMVSTIASGLARAGSREAVVFGRDVLEGITFPSGGWGPYGIAGAQLIDVAVADIDGDAMPDVVALDTATRSLRVFHASAALAMVDEFPLGSGTLGAAEVQPLDVDDDGVVELVVHAGTEVLLIGRRPTRCP
jgi:hypothetical protein